MLISKKQSLAALLLACGMVSLVTFEASAKPNVKGNAGGNAGGNTSEPVDAVSSTNCIDGGVKAGLLGFTSCISGTGNDVQSGKAGEILFDQLSTGVFGNIKNWSLLEKVNAGETGSAFQWSGNDQGNWSVKSPLSGPVVLSLKAGTAWSAYYFADVAAVNSGTWNTLGVEGKKAGQDLSHASLFIAPSNSTTPVEVPEPASLTSLGLVAVASLKILKKKPAV